MPRVIDARQSQTTAAGSGVQDHDHDEPESRTEEKDIDDDVSDGFHHVNVAAQSPLEGLRVGPSIERPHPPLSIPSRTLNSL